VAVQHFNQVELSRRWRLSPRTLERWRFQGTGPHYLKVGGRVVYRLEDVEAYEVEQLQAAVSAKAAQPTAPLRLVRA
jgi:Helix-turn-helix domain